MPNHVMNRVFFECSDEKAREIRHTVMYDPDPENEEYTGLGTIDFNKLIPMPPTLMIESGSETSHGIEIYLHAVNPATDDYSVSKMQEDDFRALVNSLRKEAMFGGPAAKLDQETIDKYTKHSTFEKLAKLGKTAADNMVKYGATTWYDWSIHNWGTKWNSYDPWKGEDHGLLFSTAWSAPHPVIKALSQRFPEVTFTHEWADEDLGHNCGKYKYLGGECINEYEPTDRMEAIELALFVWGNDPEDYGLARNASLTDYIYLINERYEYIQILGRHALYAPYRLTNGDIPEGMYLYHIRGYDDDGGRFAAIEPKVTVNHCGSIVTKEPLDLGEKGYIELTEETQPNFTGEQITFMDYIRDNYLENQSPEMKLT